MDNIKDILQDVIGKMAQHRANDENSLERIWQNVLDKEELKHVRLVGFNNGILSVAVDSSSWGYTLRMKKARILKRLKEEVEDVQEIQFKIGKVK